MAPSRSQCPPSDGGFDSSWASNSGYSAKAQRSKSDGRLSGWLALLLGFGALAIALVQPNGGSTQGGFLLSSVGIFAITLGFRSLGQYRMGYRAAVLPARAGILFGTLGTAIMAYTLTAFLLLPTGVTLPALPTLAALGASPNGLVLGSQPPSGGDAALLPPPPAAPVTVYGSAEEERLALAGVVGTAAYALNLNQSPDAAWPESVSIAQDGTLVSANGIALAIAPAGSQLLYTRSSDGMSYSLTLVGQQFATVVSYDSISGMIS